MPEEMDQELLSEFLIESFEGLDQIDENLLALERDPTNRDAISAVFRAVHTIKGTCGFLGLERLEAIAHVGESLLSLLRDGTIPIDGEIANALLALTDAVRAILGCLERDGTEGSEGYEELVAQLHALHSRSSADGGDDAHSETRIGEALVAQGVVEDVDVALGLIQQDAGDPRHLGEILVEQGALEPPQVREALEGQIEQRSSVAESSIRVDVSLLDDLMNLVGELVLARNQMLQWGASQQVDGVFLNTAQRLNLITSELQARMMKTRMQPIGNVWAKFPRVVRDLSTKCDKRVEVVMEGQETELDKTLIEAIRDPLTHLVRNAVDHGIESVERRRAAGKSEEGILTLRAYHEGGQVNIEISDDGQGVDLERVRAKAVERGLVTSEAAARLGERETLDLIFRPGFSTAEQITSVSGRGVGMDVVRTNIEGIGGAVEVNNRPGHGTTFKVKIPLTLAIIPALVVTTAGDRFAIPQVNLLELVRLEPGSGARIESVQGTPVYRLRGKILPIVALSDELHLTTDENVTDDEESPENEEAPVNLVVLQAEDRQFGLIVGEINDTEEIVVKPLAAQMEGIAAFSGCTIMGDGAVALIIDVHGLARRSGVLGEGAEHRALDVDHSSHDDGSVAEPLLVVEIGADGRGAIPLPLVSRLEDFARDDVELSAGVDVVQYRGGIMRLVPVARLLGLQPAPSTDGPLQVVVFEDKDGSNVGLVVERVIDIVAEEVTLTSTRGAVGLRGSVVLGGVVTDVLDVEDLVNSTSLSPPATAAMMSAAAGDASEEPVEAGVLA